MHCQKAEETSLTTPFGLRDDPNTFQYLCCVSPPKPNLLNLTEGKQGWRSGESTRLQPICGLSLLLVLVPAPRVFLRILRFSSLHKNQHFQIQIRPGNSGEKSHLVDSTEIPNLFLLIKYECAERGRRKNSMSLTSETIV